jgi:transposase-like protein
VFEPPRCPFPTCPAHIDPNAVVGGFYNLNGSYQPKCRSQPVPRFKCRVCKRGFSRQTFRMDYCDNKPFLNALLFKLLASGMGLRQSGRILPLSRRCTELKARKISRHLGRLNRNLIDQFPLGSKFTLDEMETFEGQRGVLPVTVPVLIETGSMYVVATDVATIKPSGQMSDARRKAIQKEEERSGPREDRSATALSRVFRQMKLYSQKMGAFEFVSDKKIMYSTMLKRFFGSMEGQGVLHTQISSKQKRDQTNPLKHINLTNAMARDLNGRLRRSSWLVSKARRYLRVQLYVFAAYRNFVRRRINRKEPTPAEELGFLEQTARFEDLLTWRQDWKWQSIHPIGRGTECIAAMRGRPSALATPSAA